MADNQNWGPSPVSGPLAIRAPAQIARATIAQHSKSFALASRLLDERTRDQTAVVYTWCRRADDAIDGESGVRMADDQNGGPSPVFSLASRSPVCELARLRDELTAAYTERAVDPVLAAFGEVARERAIPVAYPIELIAGMAMDVEGVRYETWDDLRLYCWRVAGVVGLMMTHVFGIDDDRALVHAAHLGMGMQLTNICRDVAEDWERGRLYLPDELLGRYGASGLAGDLGRPMPRLARVPLAKCMRAVLHVADRYYASGDRGLRSLPWRSALAVKAASNVYRAIGRRIAATGYDVDAGRAVVSTSGKLARVAAAALRITFTRNARAARVPTRTLELCDVPEP